MRNFPFVRFFISVFVLAISSVVLTSAAQAAAFARFDGISGESKDANHQDWIDILAISEGITRPLSAATGTSRTRAAAVFSDLVLTKELDRSSVTLREKLARGDVIPRVEIELTANLGGRRDTFFKYELTNVQITSFQMSGSGNDTARPIENISLTFEEIRWIYTEFDETGGKGGTTEAGWNIETGTAVP